MKTLNHLLLVLLLFLVACTGESTKSLLTIEELSKTYPDSALHVLEKDVYPYSMDDKNAAKWCMLNLSLRDSLNQSLDVDTLLLERMMKYYKKTNQSDVLPQAGLYYGRVLALNKSYEKAIRTYLEALTNAESIRNYNLAGYIASYAADLYRNEFESQLAREYFSKAEQYFAKAKNMRSQAIALRDISYTYSMNGDYNGALLWLQKADSMSISMNDSILRSSLMNYFGYAYMKIGRNDLAENYFQLSMELNEETKLANYFSLVDICLSAGEYERAYRYLKLVDGMQLSIKDKNTLFDKYYLLEKLRGDQERALSFLELSIAYTDSIWAQNHSKELVEIKQKYDQEHLININNKLKIENQQSVILYIVLGSIIVILGAAIWLLINHRKLLKQKVLLGEQETAKQCLEVEKEKMALAAKEKENLELKKHSEIIKNFLFERTLMYEKMKMLSDLPANSEKREIELNKFIKEMLDQPFLSSKDWKMIKDLMDELYPSYAKSLLERVALTDDELNYCYLIRFGFRNDKVIILLDITKDTLKSKRHRIMKKLEMTNQNMKLEDFLVTLY